MKVQNCTIFHLANLIITPPNLANTMNWQDELLYRTTPTQYFCLFRDSNSLQLQINLFT